MTLLQALKGKGYTLQEAEEVYNTMVERVFDGEDPEEVLYEEGLEPDYVFDLLSM